MPLPRLRRVRRALAGAVGVALVAASLSACSLLLVPPPEGSEESLAALADRLRAVDGVAGVETDLSQVDAKDDPHHWIARVAVTADGPDIDLADDLDRAAFGGVRRAALVLDLHLPAGEGTSAATLDVLDAASVTLADELRRVPEVESVVVDRHSAQVELAASASLRATVDAVRPLTDGLRTSLTRDSAYLGVGPTSPGPALLDRLDAQLAAGRLMSVSLSVADPVAGPVGPTLRVETREVVSVAEELAATTDEEADAGTRDRTGFTVSPPGVAGVDRDVDGWLGLPLGSPPPPSVPRIMPDAPPAPLTEAEIATPDLTEEEAAVRAFLNASVALTGVEAVVAVDGREQCEGTSRVRVRGWVVAPVFLRVDDAQEPFDAVTASWTDQGLRPVDRALGLDIWAPEASGASGVAGATIRGTAEGLSLSATSACGA